MKVCYSQSSAARSGQWMWSVLFVLLSVVLIAGSGCSDNKEEGCTDDSECTRGTICQNGACSALPCISAGECAGEFTTCINTGFCSAIECLADEDCSRAGLGNRCIERACFDAGCTSRDDCPMGQVCNTDSGQCINPSGTCESDEQCAVGDVCDTDISRCVEGGTPEPGVDPNPGMDPNPDPDPNMSGDKGICESCALASECGGADDECTIIGMGGEMFCTTACNSDGDCPSGFECAQNIPDVSSFQCLPLNPSCGGCLRDGCGQGETCDPVTQQCGSPGGNCEACNGDGDCAPGGKCYTEGNLQVCGIPCTGAQDCPGNFDCVNREGSNVCVTTDLCGFGGDCNPPPMCTAETPILNEEFCTCVECDSSDDCATDLQCGTNFRCLRGVSECENGADCGPDAPFCLGGFCVECVSSMDCATDGDQCFAGACEPCECPVGQRCDSRGNCIENTGCQTDADCPTMGFTMGRCFESVCYTPGVCGASDTDFQSTCPGMLSCGPVAGGIVNACIGCTSNADCRPGESCSPDLLGDPNTMLCSGFMLP